MSLCPTNPIRGNHLTDNFTFDEVNKQIVPKPGTDTKAGALALKLGNAAGDTTNSTDALTAAGFNTMASAVDGTAPLCGNEIQQAVAVAVGQSIACDAGAQEAIACAIASNPDAVACLKAVLGGSTSGKYYVATSSEADWFGNNVLVGNAYKVDNGVVTNLTPSGLSSNTNFLVEVNKDNPVAYYREIGPINYSKLTQVVMNDTGVSEIPYDFGENTIGNLFYDSVTKNLYARGSLGGGLEVLKITLSATGLITSVTNIPALTGEMLLYAAHGKLLVGAPSISGYPEKSFDLLTNTLSTFTTGVGNSNFKIFDISPDGTKWAHSGQRDGYGGIAMIRNIVTGALIAEMDFGKPVDSRLNGGGFFTEDNQYVVVAGARMLPGGVGTPATGNGHMVFSATTGALVDNKLYMVPTYSAGGAARFNTMQSTASNNAMLTQNIEWGAIGEVRILENKNDVWIEVARLPGTYNRAGFYLVSP